MAIGDELGEGDDPLRGSPLVMLVRLSPAWKHLSRLRSHRHRPGCHLIAGALAAVALVALVHRHLVSVQEPDRPCPSQRNLVGLAPDVVHFIHLGSHPLSFVALICVAAAALNQDPDKVVIHTDRPEELEQDPRLLRLRRLLGPRLQVSRASRPTHVYGAPLGDASHAADVLRLQLALKHGGLFLDEDTFLARPVSDLRAHEVSLGRPAGGSLGTQFLLCKPRATFVELWLQSYRDYRPSLWYFNAGEYPTQALLGPCPGLAHQEEKLIGVDTALALKLYGEKEGLPNWRSYYAIHLLAAHRHYLVPEDFARTGGDFDEENIRRYNGTFGAMARDILERMKSMEH